LSTSSALVVVAAAIAVLSTTAECAEKVQLALYSEALCNGCIYYANSALKAMNEASNRIQCWPLSDLV